LPLVELSQSAIDRIVAQVPGGVRNVQDIYPLTAAQEGILFHHCLQTEGGDAYQTSALLGFDDKAALDSFIGALESAVARHDVLRTSYVWKHVDRAVQVVWRGVTLPVEAVECGDAENPSAWMLERFDRARFRIDLSSAPPIAGFYCHASKDKHWLLVLVVHHIALDQISLQRLIEEVVLLQGGASQSLPPPVQFRDFVALAQFKDDRNAQSAFFRSMLGQIDEPTAPFGLMEVRGDGSGINKATKAFDESQTSRMRRIAQAHGVSVASVFHFAWAIIVGRVSGCSRPVFGTVLSGRSQGATASSARALGMFINTLPICVDLRQITVADALRATHARVLQLLEHELTPLDLALDCSQVSRELPLFSALLNYRSDTTGDESAKALRCVGLEVLHFDDATNYPLMLDVDDRGLRIGFTAEAIAPIDPERICALVGTTINSMLDRLERSDDELVEQINILPPDEWEKLIHGWNDTRTAYLKDKTIQEFFEAQVARIPDAVAVIGGEESVSYQVLNARANQLARYLRRHGVETGAFVGLCVERSLDMLVGLMAILKAGAVYVPIDPSYPQSRISYMLNDSKPTMCLSHQRVGEEARQALARSAPVVDLLADCGQWAEESEANLACREIGLTARHLAYVIYTSGSTGQPKGVMIEHRGLVNYTLDAIRWFGLSEQDVVLQQNSLNFDLSLEELMPALLAGATVMPSNSLFGLSESCDPCPSVVHLSAAHWHTLVGEWSRDARKAQTQLAGVRLINVTG
ncbi:AMP-binding protein, partial [Denitromonas iodatirespirans]